MKTGNLYLIFLKDTCINKCQHEFALPEAVNIQTSLVNEQRF